jgi:hypothetical protein
MGSVNGGGKVGGQRSEPVWKTRARRDIRNIEVEYGPMTAAEKKKYYDDARELGV